MQRAKWLAIGLCILFVVLAYGVWTYSFSRFNPNPATTTLASTRTCTTPSGCGEFRIVSVNVTLQGGEGEVSNGIQSQSLSLQLEVLSQVAMSSVQVFVNGTSVGTENGPFPSGLGRILFFPVPTTISVTPGATYAISVQGTFQSQVAGGAPSSYVMTVDVVATS